MSTLLPPSSYAAVRAVLGASLSAIPDATLDLAIFNDAAEQDVVAAVPNALALTGADLTHARNAAVYFAASRLTTSAPIVRSEKAGPFSVDYETGRTNEADTRRAEFIGLAYRELHLISTVTAPLNTAHDLFTGPPSGWFGYARGNRGGWL